MTTITREFAQDIIKGHGYGVAPSAVEALARIALASQEAVPVAGEARFKEEHHWSPCTAAHVAMVLENPADWPNYEVRYLYAATPAPVVPGEWKQWIADAVEYLEGGLEADGELEAEGSIEAKRLLSRRAAMLHGAEPAALANKLPDEKGASLQLRNLIRQRHAEWSDKTFGNVGPVGPLKHLSKEALEAAAEPDDLSEWADMQFLLWDAQRRAGICDGEITAAMIEKLEINKARQWPEPKEGEPRLHIKEQPVTQSPLLHSFYIAYYEWLKSGADAASCIFDRHSGLCANAYDYFTYIGADESGLLYEMHDAFEAAGLNRELPFNKDKENYDRENSRGECHVNPTRVEWVKHHAAMPQGKAENNEGEPTDDERIMAIEGISVVKLPPEFYSGVGRVVQIEKVMAALAVAGIEYERPQTSPQNIPENIPQWIPCSERIPETDGNY